MEKSHGMSQTRLYTIWKNMKQRCYNPKRNRYQWYGGKGITVCEEWHTFIPFMQWALDNGYTEELVLDRKDSDKNYDPDNCSWITVEDNALKSVEQRTGKPIKGNEAITYNGKTQTIKDWAAEYEIPYKNLYNRIRLKWDMERALTQPIRKTP
ncbi:HNH endonuclease [Bacillus phage CM1]|nr:HNH endonuclease [Bacillus phage CM1]